MLKKMILGLFVMLLSVNLYAGDYDGIWTFPDADDEYVTYNQNGNSLVEIYVEVDPHKWEASIGSINGNVAQMKTLINPKKCVYETTLTFDTLTTATVVLTSVTGSECPADGGQVGDSFTMNKIF